MQVLHLLITNCTREPDTLYCVAVLSTESIIQATLSTLSRCLFAFQERRKACDLRPLKLPRDLVSGMNAFDSSYQTTFYLLPLQDKQSMRIIRLTEWPICLGFY